MNNQNVKSSRFDSIDGLRMIACIGIVLMHVLSNMKNIDLGSIPNSIIGQFTNFVFLFMVISSFGMCCGYFNKIKNNEISPENFYSKRIKKILPFFLFLVLVDIIIEHSFEAIIEGFADSTLLFGLLQKNITVIGVGWFLGLVFIFYLMFPYFTYLFSNKKRAWFTIIIALLMSLSSIYYFKVGRSNMFYSFIYFCIGGMIYLYKDYIINFFKNNRLIGILLIITSTFLYFILPLENEYLCLIRNIILSISLLCYAISYSSIILNNKITRFIGNISFEIYLCHMVIFRIVEKLKVADLFNNIWLSYILTFVLVFCGSILMALIFKKCMFMKNNKSLMEKQKEEK